MIAAFERFDQIGASPQAAGWLKTVTTNACLNHLSRYRARWRLFSELRRAGDEDDGPAFEDTVAAEETPGEPLDEAAQQARVEAAVKALPAHQRVPLVLFHFEQKSYTEIADLLRISLAKVKTDIHRGREALRRALSG